jgi:hypothetical protein
MGRPQKHTEHPLYKLRLLLSETGRAITQPELSRIVDIPVATLQSIECGRRGWTDEIRTKIRQAIWAIWDEDKKRWLLEHSSPPEEFSYSLFKNYQRFITDHAPIPETDPETIKLRIDALFQQVPKDSWIKLYWYLQDCLEECQRHFELRELERFFQDTRDKILFTPFRIGSSDGTWTGEPIQRVYKFKPEFLRGYYERCAKHYSELTQIGNDDEKSTFPKIWSGSVRLDE